LSIRPVLFLIFTLPLRATSAPHKAEVLTSTDAEVELHGEADGGHEVGILADHRQQLQRQMRDLARVTRTVWHWHTWGKEYLKM